MVNPWAKQLPFCELICLFGKKVVNNGVRFVQL